MGLFCHVTCMLTDPGAVPVDEDELARLNPEQRRRRELELAEARRQKLKAALAMGRGKQDFDKRECRECQQEKPMRASHCRVFWVSIVGQGGCVICVCVCVSVCVCVCVLCAA